MKTQIILAFNAVFFPLGELSIMVHFDRSFSSLNSFWNDVKCRNSSSTLENQPISVDDYCTVSKDCESTRMDIGTDKELVDAEHNEQD